MTFVAHYPFDEDSGSTANDVTGNGYDGTINGATVGQTGILGTTCYSFDGTDDYMNSTMFDWETVPQWTVTCWAQIDDKSQNRFLWSHDEDGSFGEAFASYDSTNDNWLFRVSGDSTTYDVLGGGSPTLDQWYFIACRCYENDTLYMTVNNETFSTSMGNQGPSTANFQVGRLARTASDYWSGLVDEVRIYDHALTDAEVQHLYNVTQHNDYTSSVRES